MMAGDTIYREGNWWQAIHYTEIETDGSRYHIRRWEFVVGGTIYETGTDGRRYYVK